MSASEKTETQKNVNNFLAPFNAEKEGAFCIGCKHKHLRDAAILKGINEATGENANAVLDTLVETNVQNLKRM